MKTSYTFSLNILNKKYDKFISAALRNTNAQESYFNKLNHFSLAFHFFTPKECDLHCSHEVMLRTKQTHTYTYKFSIFSKAVNIHKLKIASQLQPPNQAVKFIIFKVII